LVEQRFSRVISALAAITVVAACGGDTDPSQDPAAARGELIYRNICVVCHNADPNEEGTLGPAIGQATRALLEAKVLRGEYPDGYTPTRDTHQMPQFEYLEPNLDDIEAFLASRRK
jgi:mono/diheme cytochrome c family protein